MQDVATEITPAIHSVTIQSHLVITKAKSSDFSFRYNEINNYSITPNNSEMPENVSKPRGTEEGGRNAVVWV